MSTYLGRLKGVLAENIPTPVTDKTDRSHRAPQETGAATTDKTDTSPFVSSVSDQGGPVSNQCPGTARRPHRDVRGKWSEAIDRLLSRPCPEAESGERWVRACQGVEQFAQQWSAKAKGLGRTFDELFALAEPIRQRVASGRGLVRWGLNRNSRYRRRNYNSH